MSEIGARAQVTATLAAIAADLRCRLVRPAVLIGSAAACLAGIDVVVADIDLLVATDDARRLESAWSRRRVAGYVPARGDRFRSRFSRYAFAPLPVEVMGDLELCVDGRWQHLDIGETHPIGDGGDMLRMPTVAEQQRVLALFGRDKDHARAAQLQALADAPG